MIITLKYVVQGSYSFGRTKPQIKKKESKECYKVQQDIVNRALALTNFYLLLIQQVI